MLHRRSRLAARFLAISLLAATLFTVDSLASPDTAEARCAGVNNPVRSTFSYNGTVRASETAGADTCNGNNFYAGVLKDESSDGYCVSVWFHEVGMVDWSRAGRACGGTVTISWQDGNGNSRVYEQFCIDRTSMPGHYTCGWGTQVGIQYYGTNYGY
jgi:hypothetical protein